MITSKETGKAVFHRPVPAPARPAASEGSVERPSHLLRYLIEPMTANDVAEVNRVECRCFSSPWPMAAYRRELQSPDQNHYLVLRQQPVSGERGPTLSEAGTVSPFETTVTSLPNRTLPRRILLPLGRRPTLSGNLEVKPILGFVGMWIMFDEAHITTIGIDPDVRGRGLGELLLVAAFDEAMARRALWLTLEVRVSNDAAQNLYRKYGFSEQGRRRRYYSDNNEDALIMWSRQLNDAPYQSEIGSLRRTLLDKLGHLPTGVALNGNDRGQRQLQSAAS